MLDVVSGALPAALVGEGALRALRALAGTVPCVARSFGFECRLGADDAAVDLGMAVTAEDGGREALGGFAGDPLLARAVARDERWRRLSHLAARWRDPTSPLHHWVPFVGLEFDAASAHEAIPVPSVFVALDTPLADESAARPSLAAAREAAALLRGGLSPALEAKLVEGFDRLPPGAHVLHLGAMLGRDQEGLRLSVAIPGERVEAYLRSLGGDGAAGAAALVLEALPRRLSRAQVDFDFLPAVGPRIGFGVRPETPEPRAWAALVGELVALGCAHEAKARALLEWPGASPATRGGARDWISIRRQLSHVKLVSSAGLPLEAKAYFGATLVPSLFG